MKKPAAAVTAAGLNTQAGKPECPVASAFYRRPQPKGKPL